MILALRTGWTPDVIGGDAPGGVTASFRRAAHGWLYAERLTPVLVESQEIAATAGNPKLTAQERAVIGAARVEASNKIATIHGLLYPEDDSLG